jgi:hypothetical protein
MIAARRKYVEAKGPGIIHEVSALAHHAAKAAAHAAAVSAHFLQSTQGRERDYEERRDVTRELAHPRKGGKGMPYKEAADLARSAQAARKRPR